MTGLVVFRLDELRVALASAAVVRVVRAVHVTRLPEAPEIILGVINLQASVVPMFDIRRRFGRVLPAVLASVLYFSSGLAAERRVLVLIEADAPPYTNTERTGFFDVIAIEAFRRARLELRLEKLPAERALLLSNSGVSAGELNRLSGIETQYPNLVRVPEKLGDWHFAAFSKDASIPGRIEAIRERRVGLIRGWKVYQLALAGAEDVITVEDPEQLFRLLQLDRIEVALYERLMGLAHIKEHGIKGVLVVEPPLFIRETFIYLHRRHAGQVPALTAALRAMKRDGTYQRAYDEILRPYFRKGAP